MNRVREPTRVALVWSYENLMILLLLLLWLWWVDGNGNGILARHRFCTFIDVRIVRMWHTIWHVRRDTPRTEGHRILILFIFPSHFSIGLNLNRRWHWVINTEYTMWLCFSEHNVIIIIGHEWPTRDGGEGVIQFNYPKIYGIRHKLSKCVFIDRIVIWQLTALFWNPCAHFTAREAGMER